MTAPSVKMVDTEGEFRHVRFRDPDDFEEIRTPDWASNVSDSVSKNSEVRMGKTGDDWKVQSVLIRKRSGDEEKARELAERIIRKIEED
jgi:hypothetical protein